MRREQKGLLSLNEPLKRRVRVGDAMQQQATTRILFLEVWLNAQNMRAGRWYTVATSAPCHADYGHLLYNAIGMRVAVSSSPRSGVDPAALWNVGISSGLAGPVVAPG